MYDQLFEGQGTPTIIINGWKLAKPPTEAELDQMVRLRPKLVDGYSVGVPFPRPFYS